MKDEDIEEFAFQVLKEHNLEPTFSHRRAFCLGAESVKNQFITYLKKYREAYGEEIFPIKDLSQFDPNIVTVVAGRMGRFILDNCIKDWEGKK